MKKLFSSPDLIAISQLERILQNAGVGCFVRNEISAGLFGEIPMNECTPELWIEDDRKLAEATQIKSDWRSPSVVIGGAWACPTCGETSEPQFTSCWKCGAIKG